MQLSPAWPLLGLLACSTAAPAAEPLANMSRGLGAQSTAGPSLFAGTREGGLFAPLSDRRSDSDVVYPDPATSTLGVYAEWIRGLIAQAEAGPDGYDAVQHGAKIRPHAPPTQLTLAEIYAWIEDTPGQNHAIGRYQFIPVTLRRLVERVGVPPDARFSPNVQDALADELLHEAGLEQLLSGEMTRTRFMNRLAAIWAGLPTSSGKSHYHGHAGNKATMSWGHFEAEMAKFFPG